jgi:cysteine-rich repeat protein
MLHKRSITVHQRSLDLDTPSCGDGNVQLEFGEACDNGTADCNPASADCYNLCTTSCTMGPYCGDGIVNGDAAHPEACDDGINTTVT